jgi:hypothetical protein
MEKGIMVTGREIQLTKQVGEYLVCAELCRRGLISTAFNGNVPDFDILAIDNNYKTKPIQVKTIKRGNWQFDAERYLEISKNGEQPNIEQKIIGLKKLPDEELIFVFVNLVTLGKDEFYILKSVVLQKIINEKYSKKLREINGIRPREPESTHTAINGDDLVDYKDNWNLILE